ncbi:hypothetical protein Ancab_027022 [Ancistrocladus abbreviatus]
MTRLLNPPDQNLPMILADSGFDVWIANTRGTRFSRNHLFLDPSNRVYSLSLLCGIRDGILAKYNYGRAVYNLEHYGEERPPIYNLSNIPTDIPLCLGYGGKDALSEIHDVGTLPDCLKFHAGDILTVQFISDYAHADFVMGTMAKHLVYSATIKFFKRQ